MKMIFSVQTEVSREIIEGLNGPRSDMHACVEYVMDSSKRQKEAMSTGRPSPSSPESKEWFS